MVRLHLMIIDTVSRTDDLLGSPAYQVIIEVLYLTILWRAKQTGSV